MILSVINKSEQIEIDNDKNDWNENDQIIQIVDQSFGKCKILIMCTPHFVESGFRKFEVNTLVVECYWLQHKFSIFHLKGKVNELDGESIRYIERNASPLEWVKNSITSLLSVHFIEHN